MKVIYFSMALLLLMACNNNKNDADKKEQGMEAKNVYTPAQLNERILWLESSLEEPILKAEAEIKVRGDKGNLAGVIQSAGAIEDSIQLRIDEVKKLSPVGTGGEDFKLVATRYFEYLKSIYTTYRQLAEATTDAAKQETAAQMKNIISAQEAVMANLRTAQQKYAADNGFAF